MGKQKARRRPLDPDDVIAGRVRPDARELVALIRDVNPTGLGLDPRETARRYAQKSRLQSSLITRFRDAIDAGAEPDEPGVVSLRHRPSGLDACHAVIAELDDDARSWIQQLVDLASTEGAANEEPGARPSPQRSAPVRPAGEDRERVQAEGALDVSELMRQGRDAVAAYDFEIARTHFEAALERSAGGEEPAGELLALLVDTLAADAEALDVEARLAPAALDNPSVRVHLAIAAARRSARERALRLLKEGGARAAPPPARAAEAFVALARDALARGQADEAAQDIARARALAPAHPALAGLADALAKARASARGPAETELSQAFAAGDDAVAEERARALLARWPESDVGRRIARALEARRRHAQAAQSLAAAREALAGGETTAGLALLRRALTSGLQGEDATWAERRIAAIEDEARGREESARIEEIRRMILAGDLAQGLPAYAALDAAQRRAVAEPLGSPPLLWLDQLAPPGAAAKAKAAIPAILGLRRAAEIAGREPQAALDLLRDHEKILQGVGSADDVRREAQAALTRQRRRAAQARIEASQRALAEGDPVRAYDALGEVQPGDLPDAAAAEDLRARIRSALERRTLTVSLEQLRREGESLRALGVLDQLLARAEEGDTPRLEALRAELRAGVQRAFCVRIDDRLEDAAGAEPAWDALHDAEIDPGSVCATLLSDPRRPAPEGLSLILAQTSGAWVFVRVVDVASTKVRTRVTLRAPAPIDLLAAALRGGRLLLIGRRGALLELSTGDWSAVRWSPNLLRDDDLRQPVDAGAPHTLTMPQVVLEGATVSADGQCLWLNKLEGRGESGRRVLEVVDLDPLKPIRAIHALRSERVDVCSISGLATPRVAVVSHGSDKEGSGSATLHDPRGLPAGGPVTTLALASATVVACPGGERVFAVACDPEGPADPGAATWGWVEIGADGCSPLRLFEGVTAIYEISAVTSLDAGMTFVLFEIRNQGCALFGLRDGGGALEIAFRASLPRRSMLLATPDARSAAVLVAHGDRHTIMELGPEPPSAVVDTAPVRFCLPNVPPASIYTPRLRCHEPSGARLAAVIALHDQLKREPRRAMVRRVLAMKTAAVHELLVLEDALLACGEPTMAGQIGAAASMRFRDHPQALLSRARVLANAARFKEARDALWRIDPARLQGADVKHLHHLRGVVLLVLGEPEAALIELQRSASCEEGTCEVDDLIAACAPLSDATTAWSPDQATVRDLMTAVASADAALARGDAPAARRALDIPLVWEAYEVQSFARLAEAYLREDAAGNVCDPFRMGLSLLSFCDLFEERSTFRRREMPLPRASWSPEALAPIAARARARAEEALSRWAELRVTIQDVSGGSRDRGAS